MCPVDNPIISIHLHHRENVSPFFFFSFFCRSVVFIATRFPGRKCKHCFRLTVRDSTTLRYLQFRWHDPRQRVGNDPRSSIFSKDRSLSEFVINSKICSDQPIVWPVATLERFKPIMFSLYSMHTRRMRLGSTIRCRITFEAAVRYVCIPRNVCSTACYEHG